MSAGSMDGRTEGKGGIASDPRWLAAAAAGLAAVVLTLWALRGLPGGALALWLTPLPLFLAGLGFGLRPAVGAVAISSVALLLVGNGFALGLFLAAFGVPVVALLLASGEGPRPSLTGPFVLLGLIPAVGILLSAFLLSGEPGGLEGTMRLAAEVGLRRMGLPAGEGLVAEMVRVKAAAIGFWVVVALLANAAAAAALLARTGLLPARPAWREARLPRWYAVLPALAGGLWLASEEGSDAVQLSLLLVLLVPLFLQGLAAFHWLTRNLPGRQVLLGGAYAALILISVPVALLATGFGLYDLLHGTRGRRGAPPPQS